MHGLMRMCKATASQVSDRSPPIYPIYLAVRAWLAHGPLKGQRYKPGDGPRPFVISLLPTHSHLPPSPPTWRIRLYSGSAVQPKSCTGCMEGNAVGCKGSSSVHLWPSWETDRMMVVHETLLPYVLGRARAVIRNTRAGHHATGHQPADDLAGIGSDLVSVDRI